MNYEIVRIDPGSRKQLRRFIDFPYKLYKKVRQWAPPLKRGLRKMLREGSGMQLSGGEHVLLMVMRDGKDAGRVLVGVNRVKNEQRKLNEGYFSLFECIDDSEAARTLMSEAEKYLRSWGVDSFTGPVSPTNGDDYRGVIIEGFERMPAVNTAYTMSYYPRLMQELGYTKYLDFYAFDLEFDESQVVRVRRMVERRAARQGVEVRPIDLSDIKGEAKVVHEIFAGAMLAHWDHLEIPTYEQIYEEFSGLSDLLDPNLALIARVNGKPAGFVAGIPDYNEVLCHLDGELDLIGAVKFLIYRRRIKRARMFMQFVLPEYQGTSVTAALYLALYNGYTKGGYSQMESSTIAEFNAASLASVTGVGFRRSRTYRIFEGRL